MLQTTAIFLLISFIGGSVNPVLVKLGVKEFPPITLTGFRFLGATLVLLPFWFRGKSIMYLRDMYLLIPFSLNVVFFAVGIQYTGIAVSGILYALSPIIVATLGPVLIKEKLIKEHIVGLCIGIIGVSILLIGSFKENATQSLGTPLGNVFVIIAVICYSLYPLGSRVLSKTYTSFTVVFFGFLFTSIFLFFIIPFEWMVRPFQMQKVTVNGTLSLSGLIVFSSVVMYGLNQLLIKRASAFISSLTLYGVTFFSALSGVIVFKEKLSTELFIGGFLTITGLFLATTYTQLKLMRGTHMLQLGHGKDRAGKNWE